MLVTFLVATPLEAVAVPRPVTVPAPPVFAKVTTVALSLVTVFPFASLIVAVSVCALPATVEPLSANVISVAGPWVYVTPAVAASAAALSVPVTVAPPTLVGEVSVAE